MLIRILEKLKVNTCFVRTKCDNWKEGQIKTVNEWIQDDKNKFDSLCEIKRDVIPTGQKQREALIEYLKKKNFF